MIPSLDLAHFTQGTTEQRHAFVQNLGKAYQDIGFVAIQNHGLSDSLQESLYQSIIQYFSLPDEVKQKHEIPGLGGQRGYTGKGKEHAKGRNTGDLKEFYHIGQTVTNGDPIEKEYPKNIFPSEIPNFEQVTVDAYRALENTGLQMLRALALFLELEETYFENKVRNGNSILRPIHYFPIENPDSIPADAVRSAEHEDINLITLLMGASAEGLQVLTRDNQWVSITALPNQIVVNVGDMLQRLTNNKLRSTTHRVINPPREKMNTPRYSIPFFLHPRSDMDLTCLPNCIDENYPKAYPNTTAGEYLQERLREIGLLK